MIQLLKVNYTLIEVQKIRVALTQGDRESESERIFCRGTCHSVYVTLPVFRKICGALSLFVERYRIQKTVGIP